MSSVHATFNQALRIHTRQVGKAYFKKISRKTLNKWHYQMYAHTMSVYIHICVYTCINMFYKYI